ncbi:MAG: hypothetical protein RIS44_3257 [Pseudomonadota bacterium]|jgi:hypothetical protein
MNTPTQGTILQAIDGTRYLIEAVHDLTDDPEFSPGDARFSVEVVPSHDSHDMGVMGYDLMEPDFMEFCNEKGIKLMA